jgi:serine/threonine protein kinase
MATGEAPFAGNTSAVIFDAILNREPPAVQERNPALPTELGRIIGKALEKDRRLRYQSAADLRADVERLKRDIDKDRTPGAVLTSAGARCRSRTWVVATGALLRAVAAVAAAFFFRRSPDRPIRELIPKRVTSNSSEYPIESMALSPDGKYLAYSDSIGVHVRSMQTADSRVLPGTQGMSVQHWAADATQFFTSNAHRRWISQDKHVGDQWLYYSVSMPGGVPHALGNLLPSPTGSYSIV